MLKWFLLLLFPWTGFANSVSSLEQGIFIKEVHFSSKRYVYGKKSRSVGGLQDPISLTTGQDGALYVGDRERSLVMHFSEDGQLQSEISPGQALENPTALASDGENLFVLDRSQHHVLLLDKTEKLKKIISSKGSAAGSLMFPQDLLFSPGRQTLIIADTGNLRVQEIDQQGKFVQAFIYAKSALEVGAPTSLARIGNFIYALYPDYKEIVRFHRNTGSIERIFKLKDITPEIKNPVQIQGFHNEILIIRDGQESVFFLNVEGKIMDRFEVKKEQFSIFSKIGAFHMDPQGNFWVVDSRESRIWKFPSNSSFQTLLQAQQAALNGSHEVAIDELEKLLQRDPQSAKALKLFESQLELRISASLQSENYEKAYGDLQRLLKVFPSNKLALTRLRILTWKRHRETLQNLFLALICLILFWLIVLSLLERSQSESQDAIQ